jgi:WD40 repeat protein
MAHEPSVGQLELSNIIGFGGNVQEGVILMPDRKHMIFPLGNTIIVRDIANPSSQRFLQGHSDRVTCLALSPSGRYLASGQVTHPGFKADAIVWDLSTFEIIWRCKLHKVKVEQLAFSPGERFLATLGGEDDRNIVLWDLSTGTAVCGSPAHNEPATIIKFLHHSETTFVSAGKQHVRVWDIDLQNRKLRPTDCNLGMLVRTIKCVYIHNDDDACYCGTASGDVLYISLRNKLFKHVGPKQHFSLGVTAITAAPSGDLLIGGGDGTVALIRAESLKLVKSALLVGSHIGSVTSISNHPSGQFAFVGTSASNMYVLKYDLSSEMRSTCHNSPINDVVFPGGYSEVFATASSGDIRVWNARTCAELLRIQVPTVVCKCICFSKDGKSILSGWSDGKVRSFGPQSGKLLFVINDAHSGDVSSIAACNDMQRIVTGGSDGCVRVWRVSKQSRVMIASMKEHKASINTISVRSNDSECVTSSSDGSCIVWDLQKNLRNNSLFASTFFKAALYTPDESQILTAGTDRKVTNWDTFDGSAIRIVDGSSSADVNALSISTDGQVFVSGGGDRLIKLWHYDDGSVMAVGVGHSGTITKAAISPDSRTIVSVGEEGAILLWSMPGH